MLQIEFDIQSEYEHPKVAICPNAWIDEEKIEKFHLSLNAVYYALGFAFEVDNLTLSTKNISLVNGKIEYDNFVASHNITSLFDFYSAIAMKSDNILCVSTISPFDCSSESKQVFFIDQVCYEPQLLKKDCTALTATPPAFLRVHNNYTKSSLWRKITGNNELIINPEYKVFTPFLEKITLFKGSYIVVKIVPKKYQMLNVPGKYACIDNDSYSQKICHHHCMEEMSSLKYANCVRLSYFVDELHFFNQYQPCIMSLLEQMQGTIWDLDKSKTIGICVQRCKPSCTKTLYEVSTTFKSMPSCSTSESDSTSVEIIYDVCESGLETFSEYNRYSVESFIANIGGVLGLWVGASAVTFVQILMHTVQALLYCGNTKKAGFANMSK